MRQRRREASTRPGARTHRRSSGWCRTIGIACRRATTSASRVRMAHDAPSSPGWLRRSSPAAGATTGARVCAVTTVRTNPCARAPASVGIAARAGTSGSPAGRGGSTRRASRPCRTGRWCTLSSASAPGRHRRRGPTGRHVGRVARAHGAARHRRGPPVASRHHAPHACPESSTGPHAREPARATGTVPDRPSPAHRCLRGRGPEDDPPLTAIALPVATAPEFVTLT